MNIFAKCWTIPLNCKFVTQSVIKLHNYYWQFTHSLFLSMILWLRYFCLVWRHKSFHIGLFWDTWPWTAVLILKHIYRHCCDLSTVLSQFSLHFFFLSEYQTSLWRCEGPWNMTPRTSVPAQRAGPDSSITGVGVNLQLNQSTSCGEVKQRVGFKGSLLSRLQLISVSTWSATARDRYANTTKRDLFFPFFFFF